MFCSFLVLLDFVWFVAEKLKYRYELSIFIHKHNIIHVHSHMCILSVTNLLNYNEQMCI